MSHFITDDAISQLPENERLNSKDLFIVSEKQEEEGRFKSRKVDYGTLSSCLYEDMDMSEIVRKITVNRRDINVLSTDVGHLSADIRDLSTRFLSNDELTRQIPGLSDIILSILEESIYFQKIDKLVDLSTGYNGLIFSTMDSAVNFCHVGSQQTMNRAIFRIPNNLSSTDERLSGRSRHLILDVSSDYECSVKFSNNCSYVSTQDITDPLSTNSHTMFIMKEIAPNVMYVQRQNVISVYSGTDAGELIAAVCYNEHKNGDDWEEGTRFYEAVSGTYVSSHTQMSAIANDISNNVNVGQYFQYIVDMANPRSRLTIGDYLAIYLSTDVVLSAVYGNNPVFTLRFYGDIRRDPEDKKSEYVLVQQFFPVAYGDNAYPQNLDAMGIITTDQDSYISSDHYLIHGWAKGELSGGICRWYQEDDWNIPEDPEDFPNANFYAITDKVDNEVSVQIGPFSEEQPPNLMIDDNDKLSAIDDNLYGTYLFLDTVSEEVDDGESATYFLRFEEEEPPYPAYQPELSDLETVQFNKLDTTIYVPMDE